MKKHRLTYEVTWPRRAMIRKPPHVASSAPLLRKSRGPLFTRVSFFWLSYLAEAPCCSLTCQKIGTQTPKELLIVTLKTLNRMGYDKENPGQVFYMPAETELRLPETPSHTAEVFSPSCRAAPSHCLGRIHSVISGPWTLIITQAQG